MLRSQVMINLGKRRQNVLKRSFRASRKALHVFCGYGFVGVLIPDVTGWIVSVPSSL